MPGRCCARPAGNRTLSGTASRGSCRRTTTRPASACSGTCSAGHSWTASRAIRFRDSGSCATPAGRKKTCAAPSCSTWAAAPAGSPRLRCRSAPRVVALDYSSAVDVCRRNHEGVEQLWVVQADICRMPFRDGGLRPRVLLRRAAAHARRASSRSSRCRPLLKRGGALAVDVYPKLWTDALWPKYWLRPVTKRLNPATPLRARPHRGAMVLAGERGCSAACRSSAASSGT